jgi:hypothetical protein
MKYQRLLEMYEQGIITENTLAIEILDCIEEGNADEIVDAIPQHIKEHFLRQVDVSTGDRSKLICINCSPLSDEKLALWRKWRKQ